MPFTPFHFGPSATISISLNQKVDVFVFVMANVIIDIEPLLVMTYNFHYPLHGYAHTFIAASFIGAVWGTIAWQLILPLKSL